MKIVVDTNVFVAAAIGSSDPIHAILDAVLARRCTLILSKPLIQELGRVLHKPNIQALHRKDDAAISRFLKNLIKVAVIVPGTTPVEISRDPTDNMLFATAIEAAADYLISGDTAHVLMITEFQRVKTIRPRDFYDLVLNRVERVA